MKTIIFRSLRTDTVILSILSGEGVSHGDGIVVKNRFDRKMCPRTKIW